MKETWFVTGSSVGLGHSIAEAALAEGHDVVASARCAGGTDCKERCHEIDPCRTSCSGHGIDRGAAHQPLFQGHAGQHRRRDQHRLSRTFIGLAMYVPAEVTARTSADFLIPWIKTDVLHYRFGLIMSHGWPRPRSWVERSYHKLIYFNEVDKGGHFAAWDEPELFSTEVRAAFRSLRRGAHRFSGRSSG
jgi:NAD(P)-dependent dehydrogenase (short-subunit alcohol dehydrogenase family)